MDAAINKVFLPVVGKPILAWSLECFERQPQVAEVIVVSAASELEECRQHVLQPFGIRKVSAVVVGGPTRHDSEFLGLTHLAPRIDAGLIDIVLIHDAVRPFVTTSMVDRLIEEARVSGAAIPGVPAAQSVVQAGADGKLTDRVAGLWAAQTPQVFDAALVLEAHRRAEREGFKGSDTSAVVERAGHPVVILEGSHDNIKITTSDDLIRAEQIARGPYYAGTRPGFLSAETASA